MCQHGLINRLITQGCLAELLATDPQYNRECTLHFERRVSGNEVYPRISNVYILSTNETDLIYRCEGQAESRMTVVAGVYELTISSPCTLYGTGWYLTATFQRTVNVSLRMEEVNFMLNSSLSDLFNDISNFKALMSELEMMNNVERKQLSLGDIKVFLQQQESTSFLKWWHSFWTVPRVAVLTGVIAGLWRRLRHMPAPPSEDKFQIELRPVSELKSAACTSTAPFTFDKA